MELTRFRSILRRWLDSLVTPLDSSWYPVPMNRKHFHPYATFGKDGEIYFNASGSLAEASVWINRPSDNEIREMLTAIRNALQLSVPALAAILGVPRNTLQKWMSGARRPSGAAARLIWLLHANWLQPEILTKPGAWLVWGNQPESPATLPG